MLLKFNGNYKKVITYLTKGIIYNYKNIVPIRNVLIDVNGTIISLNCYIRELKIEWDEPFSVSANITNKKMTLNVNFYSNYKKSDLNNLIIEIKSVLRHELTHISQIYLRKVNIPILSTTSGPDDYKLYLTNINEVEAFVMGFNYKSKLSGEYIDDIIKKHLKIIRKNLKFKTDFDDVFQCWLTYINKNLPKPRLSPKYLKSHLI